ncbi:hypothetical protein ACFY1S_00785 [Micromonospora sp. NPDC000663]
MAPGSLRARLLDTKELVALLDAVSVPRLAGVGRAANVSII